MKTQLLIKMYTVLVVCFLSILSANAQAPTITSFSPTTPQKSGATVTITGTNFTGATAVSFGGSAATSFNVVSATSITAVVGSTGTSGNVSVTNPSGTATKTGFYWYSTTIYDAATYGANDFWLTHFYYAKNTSYTPGLKDVAGSDYIDYNGGGTLTFTNINVTSAGKYIVRLYYSGLQGMLTVSVNSGTAYPLYMTTATSIVDIPVSFNAGSNTIAFMQKSSWPRPLGIQLLAANANNPLISSINPNVQNNGGTVVITGSNFTGATSVAFGGVSTSTFIVNSDTQITVTVPSNGLSGNITVTTPSGTAIMGGFLWLNTGIVYTNPTTATTDYWQSHFYYAKFTDYVGYNTKEVAGSDYLDYNGSSSIYFDNIKVSTAGSYKARVTYICGSTSALNVSVNGATNVSSGTLPIAGTSSTYDIPVTLIAGTNTIKLAQTTNWPRVLGIQLIGGGPIITSFTPTLQKNGGSVTLTGINFTGATAVSFGATAATSFTVNSDTQITATVGSGATGSVSVTAPLGTGSLSGFSWSPVTCYDVMTSGVNDFWLSHFYYAKCTDYVGSNTKEVAGSDYLDFNGGSNINFTNISVTDAGSYVATINYYSGFSTNTLNVSVNSGIDISTDNFPLSATPTTFDKPVTLVAGSNSIKLTQATNWPRVLGIQLSKSVSTSLYPTKKSNYIISGLSNSIKISGLNTKINTIEIFSIEGRLIDSETIQQGTFTKAINQGIYLVKVNGETYKVVVQ